MTGVVLQKDFELKHLNEDLTEIKRWARNVLFNKVKFLYRGEAELDSISNNKGMVYQLYLEECQEKLPGVKASESIGPEYKLIYTSLLWHRATMDNIISKGLSTGRSSSYTSMQNKFDGKYAFRHKWLFVNQDCLHIVLHTSARLQSFERIVLLLCG